MLLAAIRPHGLGPERNLLLEFVFTRSRLTIEKEPVLPLWKEIIENGSDGPANSLVSWIDFTATVRKCYNTFPPTKPEEQQLQRAEVALIDRAGMRHECGVINGPIVEDDGRFRAPIIGLTQQFLTEFITNDCPKNLNDRFEFRFDERARVIQSVVIAGDDLPNDAADELRREREICEADLFGVDTYKWSDEKYNAEFSRTETNRSVYDRYKGKSARFLVSDHSFTFIGQGEFATKTIWRKHMRSLYPPMVRLLLINGAILNGFSRELASFGPDWRIEALNVEDGPHPLTQKFAKLKERYLRFLSLNWFEQVSSSMQGTELFDILRKASQAERELRIVGESVDRAGAFFAELAKQRSEDLELRKEDLGRFLTAIVTLLGFGSLVFSMLTSEKPAGLARLLQTFVNENLIGIGKQSASMT